MADSSNIEWTDATWNPTTGCTKISPGCKNCYIESTPPFRMAGRKFVNGKIPLEFHDDRLNKPLHWKKPRRVFVNSLSDLFHDDVPDSFIDLVFARMILTPRHTYQVLTKRHERLSDYFGIAADVIRDRWLNAVMLDCGEDAGAFAANFVNGWSNPKECPQFDGPANGTRPRWPLPNLWLGVTVENQAAADERIPHLLRVPAAVRFLSVEPLLGPVDLTRVCDRSKAKSLWISPLEAKEANPAHDSLVATLGPDYPYSRIDWVIVGGESGPNARPCDVACIRSVVGQCRAAGTKCFVKQLGSRPFDSSAEPYCEFTRYEHWVAKARSWLGGISGGGSRYKESEKCVCVDAKGRICSIGRDFMLARDECAYPVRAIKPLSLNDHKGGDPAEWPEDLRVREVPEGGAA